MVVSCIVQGCDNKQKGYSAVMFHRFKIHHKRRKVWLAALNMDPTTPVETLKKWRVCSEHFTEEDYTSSGLRLKAAATPTLLKSRTQSGSSSSNSSGKRDAAYQRLKHQDEWTTTSQSENGDIKEDEDEELSTTFSVRDGRYLVDLGSSSEVIVDEECILQLFRSCRKCSRQCAVRKHVQGLKLVVSQACCFCESRSKWTNLPDEDDDGDFHMNGEDTVHGQSS